MPAVDSSSVRSALCCNLSIRSDLSFSCHVTKPAPLKVTRALKVNFCDNEKQKRQLDNVWLTSKVQKNGVLGPNSAFVPPTHKLASDRAAPVSQRKRKWVYRLKWNIKLPLLYGTRSKRHIATHICYIAGCSLRKNFVPEIVTIPARHFFHVQYKFLHLKTAYSLGKVSFAVSL